MVRVQDHPSVLELERRFVGWADPVEARHARTIWLLAQGHTVGEVSKVTAFGERWLQQLAERDNAGDPQALGNNGAKPRLPTPEVLGKLRVRLAEPPFSRPKRSAAGG